MPYSRFRHLAIERARPAPTEDQLSAVETLLGATLPASFREFLRVSNGGYLEYVIDVPFGDGQSESLCFCSIFSADADEGREGTLLGAIRSARRRHDVPRGVLPFARDGGGSAVFLDLSPEGGGRVVAFVEGLPAWIGSRGPSGFVELAPSFDAYVERLRIDRDSVLAQLGNDVNIEEHVISTEEWLDIGMPSWRDDPVLVAAVDEARRRVAKRT